VSPRGANLVSRGAERFLDAEIRGRSAPGHVATPPELIADLLPADAGGRSVNVAAIGTTAAKAVRGELLARAIVAQGFVLDSANARATPDELFDDQLWQLGVALSPCKKEIGERCDALAPSARATGVVDTVLRTEVGAVGFNTNTWAAMSALELLTGNTTPSRFLLLGSGASARSVALAIERGWPRSELVVAARTRASAAQLAGDFGARIYGEGDDEPASLVWDVVVNTTSWGETEDSEAQPLGIDLEGVFAPGGRLFDLNNRISALQHQALAAGCAVMSGSVMQRVTNASRAALLLYARDN
jgi:shikimate dehydrogenase